MLEKIGKVVFSEKKNNLEDFKVDENILPLKLLCMMVRKKKFCQKYLNIMMVKIHSKNILSTSWTRKKIMAKILNDEKFTLTSHH